MAAGQSKPAPSRKSPAESAPPATLDYRRFLLRFFAFLVPVIVVWVALTPVYNRFLTLATENLVQLIESPDYTSLEHVERHYFLIQHERVRGTARAGSVSSVRITDTHFPLLYLAALFLAVPGIHLRSRLERLGQALLVMVFFHLLALVFQVQFVLALQAGDWSAEHYSSFSRNAWALGKHLLDLPFKFAMPLILWCAFFFDQLPGGQSARA